MIGWLLALALAQEQVAAPDEAAPDEAAVGAAYEITVWGAAAIRQYRYAIVSGLEDLGWRKTREKDGEIHFRPPSSWMGRATLYYDGTLTFRRPVVAFNNARAANPVEIEGNPHFARDPGGLAYPDGWALPHPEGSMWILPSWQLLGPVHARVEQQIEPLVQDYRAVVERTRAQQAADSRD